DIEAFSGPHQLGTLNELAAAFNQFSLQNSWHNIRDTALKPSIVSGLATLAELHSLKISGKELTEDELKVIRTKVDELLNIVLSSSINMDLKRHLIGIIRELQEAIINYYLFGAEGIQKALERG